MRGSSQQGLQHALDRFSAECDQAGTKTNTKKIEVLHLSRPEQDFLVWPFRSKPFRSDYEMLQKSHMFTFLMQTYLNQRKVLFKKTTNMIQQLISINI